MVRWVAAAEIASQETAYARAGHILGCDNIQTLSPPTVVFAQHLINIGKGFNVTVSHGLPPCVIHSWVQQMNWNRINFPEQWVGEWARLQCSSQSLLFVENKT